MEAVIYVTDKLETFVKVFFVAIKALKHKKSLVPTLQLK